MLSLRAYDSNKYQKAPNNKLLDMVIFRYI